MVKQKIKETAGNITHEKLAGLPFKMATEMKKEQTDIHMNVWKRFEEAKFIYELSQKPEYKFWNEKFQKGITCSYGHEKEELVKIFADKKGALQININEKNRNDVSAESLLEILIKTMSESFGDLYFRAIGVIPVFNPAGVDSNIKDDKPEKQKKNIDKK